jgi:pimeloyl-ACP methyl ester carboxylesterase
VFEFHKILPLLTEPQQHGGSADQAFHVVCPSIPGYGFSTAPKTRGWGTVDTCKTFNALMIALNYDKYFAQGGDWGAIITRSLGVLFPNNVQAM